MGRRKKTWHMTQLTFSSNFYWNICFKFCILEQIIATVLFICISSITNKRSLLRFQSTTAPTNRGWSACGSTCLPLQDAKWPPQFVYTGDLGTIHLLCKPSSGHWIFTNCLFKAFRKLFLPGLILLPPATTIWTPGAGRGTHSNDCFL